MKENIEVTRFTNGLTILTEKMPDVRSATLGFFYKIGSRHEPANLSGISHFIEHCVFKGTDKRNALEIAIETDRLCVGVEAKPDYVKIAKDRIMSANRPLLTECP